MPHVITITGPSGAGKSTTIRKLMEFAPEYPAFVPELVPKYTTRSERKDDLEDDYHEVICVPKIPPECDLRYIHCEKEYGLELNHLFSIVAEERSPIVILNDIRAVEDVRNALRGLVRSVFVFRKHLTLRAYDELAKTRDVGDKDEPERRFDKARSIYRIYIENIHLFDHVIINCEEGLGSLERQVKQIIKGLNQDLNWPLHKQGVK